MATGIKVYSVKAGGKIRRTITKPSTDERIVALHRALGSDVKEAYRKLNFLNHKIAGQLQFQNC